MKSTYTEMKDSGVEWLGMIPKHWKLIANKYVMKKQKTICQHWQGENIMSLTKVGVIIRDINNPFGKMPETFDGYQYVQSGNLLMCLFDIDVTPRCVGRVLNNGVTSPAYSNFKLAENASLDYYYYYYLMLDNEKTLLHLAKNLRHSFTEEHLAQLKVPFPPLPEQTAIAAYLDEKCGTIDEIIADAKASIEEYKAWKSSVIFEAVTKGLDPHAEMKDSGVEWIGKVPKNANVVKLKYLIKGYKAGPFGSALITNALLPIGEILVYTPEHIALKSVESEKNLFLSQNRREEMSQFFVFPGDIIFPIVGSLGRAMQITESMPTGIINQRLAKFRLNEKSVDRRYFMWLFAHSSFYSTYIDLFQRGSIIVNLTKTIVGDMPFICYDLPLQRKIADYLDEKCSTIDGIIAEKKALIADMEAYKKSLIFETVTGKRKVC